MLKKSIPNNNRHARWIEEFNNYKTNLVYEKRKRNLFADILSGLLSKVSNSIINYVKAILIDFIPNNTWSLKVMFPDIYKDPNETEEDYIFRRLLRHQKWVKEATEYSEHANKYWEHRIGFNKALRKTYKPGDYVLIRLVGRSKLNPYFYGPFKVVNKQKFNT